MGQVGTAPVVLISKDRIRRRRSAFRLQSTHSQNFDHSAFRTLYRFSHCQDIHHARVKDSRVLIIQTTYHWRNRDHRYRGLFRLSYGFGMLVGGVGWVVLSVGQHYHRYPISAK